MNSLERSYEACRKLNAEHGKTYYLATLMLPREKRKYVHALYGFARYADEIVDNLQSTLTLEEKADSLKNWGDAILSDITRGKSSDPIGEALIDTVTTFTIPLEHFQAFLHSMTMDLTINEYKTYEDLMEYVYGSAAVIGLEMVPVLGALDPQAYEAAKKLGIAFQLANFIRDVGEDLERGRIYLPIEELASFGVDRAMLEARVLTPEIKAALAFNIERVRSLQREAEPGIDLLDATSRPCIRAASELYCGIVDEVEKIGYDVFNKRAKTSAFRRVRVASGALIASWAARMDPAR